MGEERARANDGKWVRASTAPLEGLEEGEEGRGGRREVVLGPPTSRERPRTATTRAQPWAAVRSRKMPRGDERMRVSSRMITDIFCKREGRTGTTIRRAGSLKGTEL